MCPGASTPLGVAEITIIVTVAVRFRVRCGVQNDVDLGHLKSGQNDLKAVVQQAL